MWVSTYTFSEAAFLLILFQYSGKIVETQSVHVAGNRKMTITRTADNDKSTSFEDGDLGQVVKRRPTLPKESQKERMR